MVTPPSPRPGLGVLPFELDHVDLEDDEVRLYEVTFERAPTMTERAQISPRFHDTLVPRTARVAIEWTWTAKHTVVRVHPEAPVPGLGRRVGEAFRAVNEVVPLVRVIGRSYT